MAGEKIEERHASSSSHAKPQPSIETNFYFQHSAKKLKKLPPLLDHFNARDMKVLFKCCIAVWIYSLFILINPTLRVIGQATFFGVMIMVLAPPSGVIFIELMAGMTVILGACLAWAWGTITYKAALATRPAADLQAQLARIEQSRNTTNAVQASGQTSYMQVAIYNGAALDARVSATIYCMMGLFIYLMARLRVAYPKLTLVSIFGMVIADIYLTIAPLIPTFQGTIARLLVLPAGISLGVGLVCNIIFFPRSTSHLVLDGMQAVLAPMPAFLEANLLNFQNPTQHMEMARLQQTKGRVVGAFKALDGNIGFLALDASVGRFSSDDIKMLHQPLRRVLTMFSGLLQIHIGRLEFRLRDKKLQEIADLIQPESQDDVSVPAGRHHMTRLFDYRQRSKHPDSQQLLEDSLTALATAGIDLIQAQQEALGTIIQSLRHSNSRRWFKRPSKEDCERQAAQNAAVLANLQQHRAAFSGRTAKDLWAKHKHLFDKNGHLIARHTDDYSPPTGGIMLTLVLEERIASLAEALEGLLAQMVELGQKRKSVRLWLPGNLQKFLPWALDRDEVIGLTGTKALSISSSSEDDDSTENTSTVPKSNVKTEAKSKLGKRKGEKSADPNSAATQLHQMRLRGVQKRPLGGRILLGIGHWFSSIEGMYALRVLVATIAVGIAGVIPHTAGFFYRNKGLWALIMCQTALLPYTADFVAGFIIRILGTVVGAILGMVVWYTGSGLGIGNPYGIAAIIVPFIIIFMWLRLFGDPALLQGVVLMTVTTYLVWAYSWDDTHIPSYGNPGVGYNVFWRRMLLVMVGFTAAAIVTFFPRPPSASLHYRRVLGGAIQSIKNDYTLFTLNASFSPDAAPASDLKVVAEKTALATAETLLAIQPTIPLTRFEFSSSNFDSKSLSKICTLCLTLNQSVTQLLLFATHLPPDLRIRFLRVTGATEENHVADVNAVLTMIQQSMKTGDPLPAVMPSPLVVRCLEGAKRRVKGNEHILQFTEELLEKDTTRLYCTAMSAYIQLLSTIDELVVVVKDRVGETGWDGDVVWGDRGTGDRRSDSRWNTHHDDDGGAGATGMSHDKSTDEKQEPHQSQAEVQPHAGSKPNPLIYDEVTSVEKGKDDTPMQRIQAQDSVIDKYPMVESQHANNQFLKRQSAGTAVTADRTTASLTSRSTHTASPAPTASRPSSRTANATTPAVLVDSEYQDWGLDEVRRRTSRDADPDWNWNKYSVCAGCGSPTCFVLHRSSVETYF